MKTPLLALLAATLVLPGCGDDVKIDPGRTAAALAKLVADGEDHVTAGELADWLIKDRRDFELIDIRGQQDFAGGHIDGARHIPLPRLLSEQSLANLSAKRKIVVYSNGSAHAAQAALLLRLTGRHALALLGGYNYWQDYLNDPVKAGVAEMDPARRARYQAVACYFAGDYLADAGLLPQGSAPVTAPEQDQEGGADALGLGLGLGTEKVQAMDLSKAAQAPEEPSMSDELGLGLGLGGDAARDIREPEKPEGGKAQRLLIKAEC